MLVLENEINLLGNELSAMQMKYDREFMESGIYRMIFARYGLHEALLGRFLKLPTPNRAVDGAIKPQADEILYVADLQFTLSKTRADIHIKPAQHVIRSHSPRLTLIHLPNSQSLSSGSRRLLSEPLMHYHSQAINAAYRALRILSTINALLEQQDAITRTLNRLDLIDLF